MNWCASVRGGLEVVGNEASGCFQNTLAIQIRLTSAPLMQLALAPTAVDTS